MELKLTPERQTIICKAIRNGATYLLAAQAAGVSYDAFNDWMNKGKDPKSIEIYHLFYQAVKKVESDLADQMLELIIKAAQKSKHWTAAAWMLERRFQDQYSKDSEALRLGNEILKTVKEQKDAKELDSGSN